ncbi:MAG: DedA family protein [Pseudomonadota bacterium]
MDAAISALIDFVAANRPWAFWIALVFATGENTAIISIIIPSTAILVGVGALVATGSLDFWPIWAGASLGALIGSTFSYWLGLRYGDRILAMWPLKNHPEMVRNGTEAFAKWGPVAIIIGHFFGPLRPVVFLMCGMARMPMGPFQVYNVIGSLGWAYVVPKFGEVGGIIVGWLWRLFTGS